MGVLCNIQAILILKMHLLFIWNSNLIGYPIIYPATLFLWPVKFRRVHPPHPSPIRGTPHFPHRLIRQDSHNYSSLGSSPSTSLMFLEQHSSYSLTGSDCQPDLWPWREVEKESSYFPKSHIQLPAPPPPLPPSSPQYSPTMVEKIPEMYRSFLTLHLSSIQMDSAEPGLQSK